MIPSWIKGFKKTLHKDMLKDIADDLERGIGLIEKHKPDGVWTTADDDDIRTLKRAMHVLRTRSR